MNEFKLGIYRHYKGNTYRVLHIAKHSEILEDMVIYQDINAPDKIWARPASMWNDDIKIDGKTVKRFELIEETF
ncbi:MAG: DUF1653 domain-containing protein [Eubacterium sp.]|nr:DUF1653 domain-containing protein [Eubacterium sp.]